MKKIFLVISLLLVLVSCKKDSVLDAFNSINQELDEQSSVFKEDLKNKINGIKSDSLKLVVVEYDKLTQDYYNYLDKVISNFSVSGNENLSGSNEVNEVFFDKGRGKHFLETTNTYRENILKLTENNSLKAKINFTLNTDNPLNREGKEIDWLEYHFKDFPMIAVITKLKTIQSDVLQLENEFIDDLLNKNDSTN